ncbi:conserved hypothetical protein [Sphingomonas sp. 8AM]|nr:conserved hypothetical protein [Sphingomonas sp. 8AM]
MSSMVVAALPTTIDAAARAGAGPRFEQAFATAGAPAHFHARLAYRAPDGVHHVEVWRDGATRVRRDTDGRLISIATRRRARDTDFRLDLFDRSRRLHTIVDRTSLYRVGRFTDWNDLAFGIRPPADRYSVVAVPQGSDAPAACRWYALETEGHRTLICWSREQAFPMLMRDSRGREIWRVTAFDNAAPAAALFRPDEKGYIVNNAARDIAGD